MSINDSVNSFSDRQEINISDRKRLSLTGVIDVESFDDRSVILKSNLGMIAIDGDDLHISTLDRDSGQLIVEGLIGGVIFFDPQTTSKKRSFLKGKGSSDTVKDKTRGFFG